MEKIGQMGRGKVVDGLKSVVEDIKIDSVFDGASGGLAGIMW